MVATVNYGPEEDNVLHVLSCHDVGNSRVIRDAAGTADERDLYAYFKGLFLVVSAKFSKPIRKGSIV